MEDYVTWLAAVSAQGRYRPIWFRLMRQWLPTNVVLISVCEHPMQERGFQQIRYLWLKDAPETYTLHPGISLSPSGLISHIKPHSRDPVKEFALTFRRRHVHLQHREQRPPQKKSIHA